MNSCVSSKTMKGECLCGLIKYEVTKVEERMGHCHCSMCRKFHGAAFATLGEAKTINFQWISGQELLKSYIASNGTTRKFCEHCGSSMIFVPSNDSGDLIEFSLGTLDTDLDLKPDAHIYTEFRANWYDISDQLPRYSQGRDADEVRSEK